MRYPQWTDPQFLDADGVGGLNFAAQNVSGAVAEVGAAAWALPGLVNPETATFAASGLVINALLPSSFGIVTSGGSVVRAHGTQTGQDTNFYAVDFTSLVPGGSPIVAYLVAAIGQIQQDPYPIPGPPPGFPSFNPNFVPTIGYATNVQTLSLSATTGVPDNVNTFALLGMILSAGGPSPTGISAEFQQRAALRQAMPANETFAGGTLTPAQANTVTVPLIPNLTFTVPLTAEVGGLLYSFANQSSGNMTIATSGADVINGFGVGGAASVTIASSGSVALWTAGKGVWDVISAGAVQVVRSNPGYRVYPGGSIRQFGNVAVAANTTLVVNYATPFLVGPDVCGATIGGVGVTAGLLAVNMNVRNAGASNTNCTISNPNSAPVAVDWWVDGV